MPYIIEVFVFTGLAVMVLYFLNILRKYAGNDKKPEITVRAAVVDKKMNADSVILSSFFHRDGGMITFLVFRTDDGKTLQLTVPRDTYYNVNIGSRGQLTYQGTKMVKFTPK